MISDKSERRSSRLPDEPAETPRASFRPVPPLVRLTAQERAGIVLALLEEQIFTLHHIPDEDAALAPAIFAPIAAGVLAQATPEYREQVGTVYEYKTAASPQTIGGYPVFLTMRVIHHDDWLEILKAFVAEHNERDKMLMRSVGVSTTPS